MFERNDKAIELLSKLMIEKQADVLSIDSFIRTHSVSENANEVIEQVIECFEDIAEVANCAVHLWHHTRKGRGEAATVELGVVPKLLSMPAAACVSWKP